MRNRVIIWLAALVVVIASAYTIWNKKYAIYDFVTLRNYTPPAAIAQIANDDTMTSLGKNIFYVNKPEISDRDAFRRQCLANEKPEQTIVLGCYTGVHIYIFKVTDAELNGVEQVTSAHEMLHAAYDRLSSSERKRVNKLITDSYQKLNDPRINALADAYNKQEPGSVTNELHSIIGTEVKNISPELEAYYSRYFTNRAKIVNFALNYENKFEDLKSQVDKLDADLALRKSEIDQLESSLQSQVKDIEAQKAQMDSLLASNQTRAFNAQVASYNQKVNDYNNGIAQVKSLIDEYNIIVEQRNQLAVQQQNLAQNLDSRLSPISNQ